MKKVILFYTLFISIIALGQRKYAADRYFNEFAYKKSAELYKTIYDKGDDSQLVISRLGDSYYYNTESEKAEKWYSLLMDKYANEVTPEYLFRYAQTLKSNGKIKESDRWLEKLKEVNKDDSRALELEKNRNYFVEYSNRKKTFVNVKNLSTNTKYSDFGGFIYGDKLYFASTKPEGTKYDKKIYKWNDQPFLNIYTADEEIGNVEQGLQVSNATRFSDVNTRYHESNAILTSDGNTLYFTRDNYDGDKLRGDDDKVTHLKIYKAENIDGEWKNLEELPFNSDLYSCGHPALSPDGKTLYFVSDMPGGYGATDIYSVKIRNDGTYGSPVNLGRPINTESREMFPYVDNENTIYFASDGHLGLGALDVFESKISDNKFTAPVNLGSPVNSPLDDFSFVISEDKSYGYFSSNRTGGKGDDDIYSFVIYRCKEDITGVVTDSRTGVPISGATVRLINEKGEPISKQVTIADGRYTFKDIACENNYTVTASKDDYRNDKKDTATEDIDKKTIQADLVLESLIVETPKEQPQIVINPIYFDFDLYNIREDAEYELEHIVTVMKNHPDMVIKIESHTDSRGTKAYNRTLSTNRAKSTRAYLISRGIASNRIESAIGYGEDQLLNHCNDANQKRCSKEEHQRNRRSYFYIVSGGKNVTSSNQ
ncbi:OmpA family protein [Tenacibaculum jejuense]|uniref:Outer membrane protein, peptidoglycan-associated lipoprotein n=1 Tax=Tenacibaculum jejuense TaxID=584609 RepID=A0A238U7I7_9FLAO|nr:OmpA family protein [Tenacibaculum jejuense]SNR15015.1 Outer membrane protein, peptidoglycan-associated lipoprotein [Tenacibaculum jejuense]